MTAALRELEKKVEKQLAADRDAALIETKSGTRANMIVLSVVIFGVIAYRAVTWLFFGQSVSMQDFGWLFAVAVLMVVINRFFGSLDWTVRDKRLIRTELFVEESLEAAQAVLRAGDGSQSRLETIERRMGRLEQLVNVVLEKQEKSVDKIERRIGHALERVEFEVNGLRDELRPLWEEEAIRKEMADSEALQSRQ